MKQLTERLLLIGGTRVVECLEEDLKQLLTQGHIISGEVVVVKMRPSKCHHNCVVFYDNYVKRNRSSKNLNIVTGWGLSDDGLWRQHSWLTLNGQIIETTVKREIYFGYVLEGRGLEEFCWNNM